MIKKTLDILISIIKLPRVTISFSNCNQDCKTRYQDVYNYFTKPHRLKLFKHKTIGVALIPIKKYSSFEDYYKQINGKNSAAYYSRKATKRNYVFKPVHFNDYIEDLHQIKQSARVRQGKVLSKAYQKKITHYKYLSNQHCFGVFNQECKLVSYCQIEYFGDFIVLSELMGHKQYLNEGIMYLLFVKIIEEVFINPVYKNVRYVMYDTFFGASKGLQLFKRKLKFEPYKVKWIFNAQ